MRSRGHNLILREGWTSVERYRTWVCVCVWERWREGEIYQTWVKHVHLSLMLQNFMITLTQALPHSQSQQSSLWNGRFSSFFLLPFSSPLLLIHLFSFFFLVSVHSFSSSFFLLFVPQRLFPFPSHLFFPPSTDIKYFFSLAFLVPVCLILQEKSMLEKNRQPIRYFLYSEPNPAHVGTYVNISFRSQLRQLKSSKEMLILYGRETKTFPC